MVPNQTLIFFDEVQKCPNARQAIKYLVPTDKFGLYHGTCEGQCSWADFTEEFYRLKGLTTKVNHISSDEYPTPTKRPAYSVLRNYMFEVTGGYQYANWKDAIKEYMESGLADK